MQPGSQEIWVLLLSLPLACSGVLGASIVQLISASFFLAVKWGCDITLPLRALWYPERKNAMKKVLGFALLRGM